MEKKKELTDKEDNQKERSKNKLKKLEESKKKREDKNGSQPCRTHEGAHLWRDCLLNPKNRGRGNSRGAAQGGFNQNFGRGFNRNFKVCFSCNNMGRSHPGRGFGYKGPGGRGNFQPTNFGRGRGNPQEQFYQNQHFVDQSDSSTLGTNQSSSHGEWDNYSTDNFHNHYQSSGYVHQHFWKSNTVQEGFFTAKLTSLDKKSCFLPNHTTFPGKSLSTTRARTIHRNDVSANINKANHHNLDCTLVVYVTVGRIQQSLPTRALIVLLDTGSSHTMIKLTSLPHGASVTPSIPKRTTTTKGVFSLNSHVILTEVKFPEFGNHCINIVIADVFNSPTCCYDLIGGRDVLNKMGTIIDFQNHTIRWLGRDLLMRDFRELEVPCAHLHWSSFQCGRSH